MEDNIKEKGRYYYIFKSAARNRRVNLILIEESDLEE